MSITTLIYKDRGETFLLANYRPIALMNVDVKIFTKLLSMRLNQVLPSITHESQTAVYGRRIHNTVHFVRDFIDLITLMRVMGRRLFYLLIRRRLLIGLIMKS